jgi:hypothetical protein
VLRLRGCCSYCTPNPEVFLQNNAHALALLRSWLRYQRVPFSEGLQPPTDLIVGVPPDQKLVHVTIGRGDPGPKLPPPGLNLDGGIICYGEVDQVLEEYWGLLQSVGIHEPLMPFDRGGIMEVDEATGKLKAIQGRKVSRRRDGEELILFRHNAFSRSPNPHPEHLALYKDTMTTATKVFWRQNSWLMKRLGYEYDEAMTYAVVWATTYIAHYEVPPPEGEVNQKLLHAFLKQRFYELWVRMRRQFMGDVLLVDPKSRADERPDVAYSDEAMMAMGWFPQDFSGRASKASGAYKPILLPAAAPPGLLMPPESERLIELLEKLPHDVRLERLQATIRATTLVEKDARAWAREYLRRHVYEDQCPRLACRKKWEKRVKFLERRQGRSSRKSVSGAPARQP